MKIQPGQSEMTHVVVSGDTVSKIAAHYQRQGWSDLTDWRQIYRLTRERTALWANKRIPNQLDNPDLIYPGDSLLIPRSRSGYLKVIQGIEELKRDNMNRPNYATQVKKDMDHYSEGLNLVSDATVFVVTVGMSAASAASAAKVAKRAVGVAAKEALSKKALAAGEMGLKIAEYGAKSTGHEEIAHYAGVAAKVVHGADLVHGSKDFLKDAKELRVKKEYWRLAGETAAQVVDVIDIALEWTQPSKLSKGMIRMFGGLQMFGGTGGLFTGPNVDATIKENIEAQDRLRENINENLEKKLTKLRGEMHLVYAG